MFACVVWKRMYTASALTSRRFPSRPTFVWSKVQGDPGRQQENEKREREKERDDKYTNLKGSRANHLIV